MNQQLDNAVTNLVESEIIRIDTAGEPDSEAGRAFEIVNLIDRLNLYVLPTLLQFAQRYECNEGQNYDKLQQVSLECIKLSTRMAALSQIEADDIQVPVVEAVHLNNPQKVYCWQLTPKQCTHLQIGDTIIVETQRGVATAEIVAFKTMHSSAASKHRKVLGKAI